MSEEFRQLKRHAKWAAQAALDAEQRIKELESQLAAQVPAGASLAARQAGLCQAYS